MCIAINGWWDTESRLGGNVTNWSPGFSRCSYVHVHVLTYIQRQHNGLPYNCYFSSKSWSVLHCSLIVTPVFPPVGVVYVIYFSVEMVYTKPFRQFPFHMKSYHSKTPLIPHTQTLNSHFCKTSFIHKINATHTHTLIKTPTFCFARFFHS